jgi:hypothetical protein
MQGMLLMEEGDQNSDLLILVSGTATTAVSDQPGTWEAASGDPSNAQFTAGNVWGESEFLGLGACHTMSVVASGYGEVARLSPADVSPDILSLVQKAAQETNALQSDDQELASQGATAASAAVALRGFSDEQLHEELLRRVKAQRM